MCDQIKVIGAGLGRTGTLSLKFALEQLGFSKCYHMHELISNPKQLPFWEILYKSGKANWECLFNGYQAIVDYPGCMFYKQILAKYPDAKVILTVRDPNEWYESVSETIYKLKPKSFVDKFRLIIRSKMHSKFRTVMPVYMFADQLLWNGHFDGQFEDREFAINKFNVHLAEVKAAVPEHQLLIYNIKDGWGPLCHFLGRPVSDKPFPYVNTRESFRYLLDKITSEKNNRGQTTVS